MTTTWQPHYHIQSSVALDQEIINKSRARIVRGVELWREIMNEEIASWKDITDFRPMRDKLMYQLRLGGFATWWPGVTYLCNGIIVVRPRINY